MANVYVASLLHSRVILVVFETNVSVTKTFCACLCVCVDAKTGPSEMKFRENSFFREEKLPCFIYLEKHV